MQNEINLALNVNINNDDLDLLCKAFECAIKKSEDYGTQPGELAVYLARTVKKAINQKALNNPLTLENIEAEPGNLPQTASLKANMFRGFLLTCFENQSGIPGFLTILQGIASVGMGMGSFTLPGTNKRIKTSELKSITPATDWLYEQNMAFLRKHLRASTLTLFGSVRLGVNFIIAATAFLPLYASAISYSQETNTPDSEQVFNLLESRYLPPSERLRFFLSQGQFVKLFDELFTHESTILSIF